MSDNRTTQERFDSWKEIAAYLNRDVRTVIRWEKERGLPVRRVPGGHKQAVFAYRKDIDTWLGHGSSTNGHAPAGPAYENGTSHASRQTEAAVEKPSAGRPVLLPGGNPVVQRRQRNAMKAACVLAGIFVLGAAVYCLYPVRVPDFKIVKIPADPQSRLAFWTDGTTLYFPDLDRGRQVIRYAPMSGQPVRTLDTPFSNVMLLDYSRDSRNLLVLSYDGIEMEKPLWTIPAHGGTPKRLGNTLCHDARWSPDNQRIACATLTSIVLLDAGGEPLGSLGSFATPPSILAWSPDGRRLRITTADSASMNYNAWEIVIGQALSAGIAPARRLPWGSHCCISAAWTRDGKEFVYVTIEPGLKERMFVRREGGLRGDSETEVPLKAGAAAAVQADRSSNRIYFNQSTADNRGELLRLDPGRHEFQPFMHGLAADNLAFSRDGQWLAYIDPVDKSLWRSRADGSDLKRLTDPPMEAMLPSWSPDGKWVAFSASEPGKPHRIFVTGRDGSPLRPATQSAEQQGAPTWSPDGRSIVYGDIYCEMTATCWIRIADLASRKSEIIPGSHGFRTARWSPDGKYIAALKPDTQELMLYNRKTRRWKILSGEITGDNLSWSSDSRYLFADCPHVENPRIERIRVSDGSRTVAAELLPLQQERGEVYDWFGLAPDDSVLLFHFMTANELYALDWKTR